MLHNINSFDPYCAGCGVLVVNGQNYGQMQMSIVNVEGGEPGTREHRYEILCTGCYEMREQALSVVADVRGVFK